MKTINNFIESLLFSTPEKPLWNQEMIRQGKDPSWNYIDGCMLTAFITLFEQTGNTKYLDFVKNYMNYFIEDNGNIQKYKIEEFNLDNINEGRVLYKLYDYFKEVKYRKAIELLYSQLKMQPRTKEGNFWHKNIYPNQVWLDGLYMAQPFYLEYEKRFNNHKNYDDILNQFKNVYRILRDSGSGLYFHAYDSCKESFWCDKETGLSPHFWLRAIGWYYMALVDVLDLLEESDIIFKTELSNIFSELTESILQYQHVSGMWYQLISKGNCEGNYLETSGSAIISYAILKAVHIGVLPSGYRRYAELAFSGICENYLYEKDGKMTLGGICMVAGLGGKDQRDGSAEYYFSEPVVENEAKGIAPFILAYIYLNNQ